MRKPLTVIIVTLFTIKGMLIQSIQRIKAMLLYIVYGIFFVDTVDTKIKACMHWMLCLSRLSILLSKNIHTFLPITFLIFNRFSICKKFWKSWDWGLFNHTINTIYINTVDTRQGSLMHSMLSMSTLLIQNTFLPITFLIFNQFSIRKEF